MISGAQREACSPRVAASSRFETLNALSNTALIMACRGLHSLKQASQNPYEGCVSSSAWTAGRTRSPAGRTTYACTARNLSRSSSAPSPMPPVHRRSARAGSRGSLRTPTDARPGIYLRTRRSTCGSAMVAPPPARQPVGRRSRTRCPRTPPAPLCSAWICTRSPNRSGQLARSRACCARTELGRCSVPKCYAPHGELELINRFGSRLLEALRIFGVVVDPVCSESDRPIPAARDACETVAA